MAATAAFRAVFAKRRAMLTAAGYCEWQPEAIVAWSASSAAARAHLPMPPARDQGHHVARSTGMLVCVILPKVRDSRLITIRRGGTLTEADHQLLALWAAQCAEHVLHVFEDGQPPDTRPRDAIEAARAWAGGGMTMLDARARGGHAMGAARPLVGAARYAAYAAGQAACVGHVPEHDLGAAAYAIRAARAAHPGDPSAGRAERDWQRDHLHKQIRALVLADQARRNAICWSVFHD